MEPLEPVVLGPGESQKICATCAVMKPATGFYFHKDSTLDDGWCPVCKECRKADRQVKRNAEISTELKHIELGLLKQIANGGGRAVMCDLVSGGEVVLQAFGGIEGLAQKLAADYEGMPIGTAGRTKILLGALQFVSKAMEQQQPYDLQSMDEDELRQKLKKALGDDIRRITDEPEDRPTVGDAE